MPRVEKAPPPWAIKAQAPADSDEWHDPLRPPLKGHILVMKRRAIHLAHLATKAKPPPQAPWPCEMERVWEAMRKAAPSLPEGSPALPDLSGGQSGWHRVVLALKMYAAALDAKATTLAQAAATRKRAELRQAIEDRSTGMTRFYRLLRPAPPGRLAYIMTEQGPTADPAEVDAKAREVWGGVYSPHSDLPSTQRLNDFVEQYSHFIDHAQTFEVPSIDHRSLKEEFAKAKATSAGPDGWTVEDLSHMTELAAWWLAQMLERIEQGTPWPGQLAQAKAIFLAKEAGGGGFDPLSFRIFTVASFIYRKWGKLRLQAIMPWVEQWADPTMYGGFAGQSAAKASWTMAAELEESVASGHHMSMLSFDIYNCFDQVDRGVLAGLLLHMGRHSKSSGPGPPCCLSLSLGTPWPWG